MLMYDRETKTNARFKIMEMKTTAIILILAAILILSGCNRRKEAQGPVIITYTTLNIAFEMEEQIAVWNQSQEECRIETQSYSEEFGGDEPSDCNGIKSLYRAAAFFEGSKTMDEVINVIQCRVSLYVSENSIKAYTALQ